MASLLSLQRELQILRVRLKVKKRALEIVPNDQKLQLDIIDLEGQIEEVATNIQFEEDITKKPKEQHTAEHNHGQPGKLQSSRLAQSKLGI
jgi:septin family protein